MEKTIIKLVKDKRKAVNSNHDTPVSGILVYGDNNHKYILGFVPTIWDDANEMLIVAHENSDPLTDTYREPFQLTVVPYEMIQYLHINMDLQNARALMKEFGFEEKIINLFLNEQAPTTDMYAFGAVRKGELDEIYKLKEEQERQAEAALMRLRNEQRSRGIGVPTYDLKNNPKDVPMAGPQTTPSAPVKDTTSDNVPVIKYRLDDPLYDPTAVHTVTRDITDSYPYPKPHVPDLGYLGVHVDENNTGTILPVPPVTPEVPMPDTPNPAEHSDPTPDPEDPAIGPAAPEEPIPAPTPANPPVAPTPEPPAGPAVTPTPASPTPAAPPTTTPIVAPPSVPVTPAATPTSGLSANSTIDLFSKLNKIISGKLADHSITDADFDAIVPDYTTTASDQISKHDFNSSLAALSTTLANIHGDTVPSITITEDATPVDRTIVDNLIATIKTMVH